MMPDLDGLILIGKVLGTHGIRGQLRLVPYSGNTGSITSLRTLYLFTTEGAFKLFDVEGAVEHKKRVLVKLKGYDNINQVLSFAGCEVYVRRDQLPALGDGEFYWCDLIGLTVVTKEGETLGCLDNIIETGSNDVYVVRNDLREILVPATEDVVTRIDLDNGIMEVSLPEGLLDL